MMARTELWRPSAAACATTTNNGPPDIRITKMPVQFILHLTKYAHHCNRKELTNKKDDREMVL